MRRPPKQRGRRRPAAEVGGDLAHYRVLRDVSAGGQGSVVLALDTRLQRRVCIKIYHYDGGLRERLRLQREALRLARLDCSNLVDVLDVVAHAGRLALVTRYLPGCSLEQLLRCETRLPAADAVAIATDLASALGALRLAGFVHGDISATNVIVGEDGRAVLIDLGAAVYSGEQPEAASEYALSPEQLRGDGIDARSDAFALGLLLYRMLTGEHPFVKEQRLDHGALLAGLQEAPALTNVPAAARELLRDLLRDLLAPKLAQRLSPGAPLRERLRAIRVCLPAPGDLSARVLAAGRNEPEPSASAGLPESLLRLPLRRRVTGAAAAFWQRGSVGARSLVVLFVLGSPVLMGLYYTQQGECVAVGEPYTTPGARRLLAVPDLGELHELLTTLVKRHARRSIVLGRGVDSDSRLTLTEGGIRDVCNAKRRLSVVLGCEGELCQVELVAYRPLDEQRVMFELPDDAPRQEFRAGLERLVGDQLGYLLD